jgi:putative transposase
MFDSSRQCLYRCASKLWKSFRAATRPESTRVTIGFARDLSRSRNNLIAENALLRHQLTILSRRSKRPKLTQWDRLKLIVLARRTPFWKQALLIVQPDTLLRWHRDLFRLAWRWRTRSKKRQPRLGEEVIDLIRQIAEQNKTWGAERIRGELLKLGIQVSKSTIQRYMKLSRHPNPGSSWSTFLHNHSHEIWACDFTQVYDLFFRSLFVFVILEIGTRRIVHAAVTRHPSDAWVAQQLREATPWGEGPKYVIRDNDTKYGQHFTAVASGSGIRELKTPYRAPKANSHCERFMRSLRGDCLDHILTLNERHLSRTVAKYVDYYNCARPHQGNDQRTPVPLEDTDGKGGIIAFPILGGLHHDYRRAA